MRRNFFGQTPADTALEFIEFYEPPEGYWLAFSGGKDSVVLLDLVRQAGVKFESHYEVTGLDPPELTRFIRRAYPEVQWEYPSPGWLQLVRQRGWPLPRARWCCVALKESSCPGRAVLLGVRAQESVGRSRYTPIRYNSRTRQRLVSPILNWSEQDVWSYIRERNLPYCELYDQGWKRLGCVTCPLQSFKLLQRSMQRWPRLFAAWKRAGITYFESRQQQGLAKRFETGEEYWEWWLEVLRRAPYGESQCQLSLFS